MLKKLLSQIKKILSYDYDRKQIDSYLSNSVDTYDLEYRLKELEKKGAYNKYYI